MAIRPLALRLECALHQTLAGDGEDRTRTKVKALQIGLLAEIAPPESVIRLHKTIRNHQLPRIRYEASSRRNRQGTLCPQKMVDPLRFEVVDESRREGEL